MKNHRVPADKLLVCLLQVVFIICITFFVLPRQAEAKELITRVDDQTIFDASYGYTFKYLEEKTKVETFGGVEEPPYFDVSGKEAHAIRITGDEQKGKTGAIWRNAGIYQGTIVDLKLTVMDWERLEDFKHPDGSVISKPQLCFTRTQVGDLHKTNLNEVVVKYEFFSHDTGALLDVKGHATLSDIDFTQGFRFHEGVDSVFVLKDNTWLTVEDNHITSKDGGLNERDKRGWCSLHFSGSKLLLTFTDIPKTETVFEKGYLQYQYFGFTPYILGKFDTPEIHKSADRDMIYGYEDFIYTLEVQVPAEMEAYYYTEFVITDTLEDCLEVSALDQIRVTDDTGTDVTEAFDVAAKGQQINIRAKDTQRGEFYNKSYFVTMAVHRKAGYDMAPWKDEEGNYAIVNCAQVTTDRGTKESEPVIVSGTIPRLEIIKSVDHYEWKPGEQVIYTVSVTQVQKNAVATNVLISDISLPSGLVFEDTAQMQFTGGKDTTVVREGNGWRIQSAELREMECIEIEFYVIAQDESAGKEITNTATAVCDEADEVSDDAVIWINDPELEIIKTADKAVCKTNDIINYRVQVRQLRDGCVARNIVIADELLNKGVSLIEESVTVTQQDGNVLSDMKVEIRDNDFVIQTGRNLTQGDSPEGIEGDELLNVSYSVKVLDAALAGESIKNIAYADCDEEKPVQKTHLISVNQTPQQNAATDNSDGRPRKTEGTKTGDASRLTLLAGILLASVAVLVFILRKRIYFFNMFHK